MLAGLDLTAYQFRLRRRDKTGVGAAAHPSCETKVGAVACLRVAGAGTAGFTALDVALRERTSAHGLGLNQLRGKIANASRDFVSIGHSLSLRLYWP
jgi:hypothetical protein